MFNIVPLSVHQKMYRFKEHFESLEQVLETFYNAEIEKVRTLQSVEQLQAFQAASEVGKRVPLIIGDCLQNMRSSLDYLIWELVKANSCEPGSKHMFPIHQRRADYTEAIKRGRLEGINEKAAAMIWKLQPFHHSCTERNRTMLAVLDQLTNINKHRHILGMLKQTSVSTGELSPRHYMNIGVVNPLDLTDKQNLISYIAFDDAPVKGLEVSSVLDSLSRYLVKEVFSRFEEFFI